MRTKLSLSILLPIIFIAFLALPLKRVQASVISVPNNFLSLSNSLVGWWTFDGKDTNWNTNSTADLSGQGHNATLTTMSTTTTPVLGKTGQAFHFTGNQIDTGADEVGAGDATVCTWIKPDPYINLFGMIYNGKFALEINNNVWRVENNGANGVQSAANTALANVWTHGCVTRTAAGLVTFYVNGVQSGTANQANGTPAVGSQSLKIGVQFIGAMDDVRIYNRILTAKEIASIYASGGGRSGISSTPGTLANGLVAWWTLDAKDTNWSTKTEFDRQVNSNTTIHGGTASTTPIPGAIGQAMYFDGANTYLESPTVAPINLTNNLTFGAWFKLGNETTVGNIYRVMSLVGTNSGTEDYTVFYKNGQIYCWTNGNVGPITDLILTFPIATSSSSWHYVMCTYSNGTGSEYVDGVKVSTGSMTNTVLAGNDGTPFRIGSCDILFPQMWSGGIDDVRIYNRVLSDSEILEGYNAGNSKYNVSTATGSLGTGLVGWWTFDGKDTNWNTNKLADVSGTGNTGTLVAMSTSTSPVIGKIGQALNFNGTGSYVSIADSNSLSFTTGTVDRPYSISTWVNMNDITLTQGIVSKWISATVNEWILYTSGGSLFMENYMTSNPLIGRNMVMAASTFQNQWVHIVATYDGSAASSGFKIYVDAVRSDTTDSSHPTYSNMSNTTAEVDIGSYGGGGNNLFNGKIDDTRIYNRALTQSEVTSLYAAGR